MYCVREMMMKMKCTRCKRDIPDKAKMVKISKPEKKQVFWIERNKTKSVADILYYHPTEGRYVICSYCETLISF